MVKENDSLLQMYIGVFLYVASGICQPMFVDLLKYQGFMGGKDPSLPSTHMGVLLNMFGMIFVGIVYLFYNPWPQLSWTQYKKMGMICLVDLLSQAMVMFGQLKVGGGLYVVLYSSCTVWTAVLCRCLLGKVLRKRQWMGVAEVTGGLILSKLNLLLVSSPGEHSVFMVDQFTGGIILLLGAVLHSLAAVATEWLLALKPGEEPVSPMFLAGWMGFVSTALLAAYNLSIGSWYGFRTLYVAPVEGAAGSWNIIAMGLPALLLANAVHSGSFFCMVSSHGAVSAGIMKGVQAVAVFVLSATVFCSFEKSQCVTVFEDGHLSPGLLKVFAMYMVVRGILAYSMAPKLPSPALPPVRNGLPEIHRTAVEHAKRL
eukprot:GGOE01020939.1.p1 GENE.GGOE01020939.1~~GGOE01020939.1.p1  ORF type:complete len:371 (-),score=83.17 GGOE01020939.1:479-1591(-)